MAAQGADITAADFNALYNKISNMLGTGDGSYGYGQAVQSAGVVSGQKITKEQWSKLRYDLISIWIHQTGNTPSLVVPGQNTGNVITYSSNDAYVNYDTLANIARSNRFEVATGQFIISNIGSGSYTYTSSWKNSATIEVSAVFSNSNQARYFFNSGGKIRISATREGGANTSQNNTWTNALESLGEIDFGAGTDPINNFYTLTNSFEPYLQSRLTTPYSDNLIIFEAKCNVASNVTGTATEVTIKMTLLDAYDDSVVPAWTPDIWSPDDLVDGTLTINLSEIRASGYLQPSGTFAIVAPTYTITGITAS